MVRKKSAHFCVSAIMVSIMLLPMQAAGVTFVPLSKLVMIDGAPVPLPFKKPSINYYPSDYKPLSALESKLYARIFEAQLIGNINEADTLLGQIQDKRLIGSVLYQRYIQTSYKSDLYELKTWLSLYSTHQGANDVYKLALSKQDKDNQEKLIKPTNQRVLSQINQPTIYYPKRYKTKISRTSSQAKQVKTLSRKVRALVRTGKSLEALKYLLASPARKYIDKVEHDIIQTKIAAGFLYKGRLDSAYKLAAKSSDRSGYYVPDASWVAGLVLWQQGDFEKAAIYFEKAGSSKYASGWLSSAGSYWAARSYSRMDNPEKAHISLENAAKHSRTFYGLMAIQLLGKDFNFNWNKPQYSPYYATLILEQEAGKRAFALVAAGQHNLADAELMGLDYKGNNTLRRAVLAYATHVGLSSVALRLGNMISNENGKYYDSASYPVSPWSPDDGYRLDPALLHAVIRQESRFNIRATSYSGAIGLMQIMPRTAQYVAKTRNYSEELDNYKLRIPKVNMKVGQDYLEYLLNGKYVKGDIISLLVAYNAGPGNLLKWKKRMGNNTDPLLFIEMMPVKETRDYVEHVLSNYWIYRMRAGLDLPSLTALTGGNPPRYAHIMQTEYPYKLASN